ncbi:hypothetical protein BDZ88DRAFT_83381 [Geranomyces variabilis]|nr:hypothetical protein BDZ88DRAFT_83381 [Geranomyces variabilis]
MEVQWQFQSNTSGLAYYHFGVGSAPGLTDLVPRTRTLSSNVTFTMPTPSPALSQVYFFLTGVSGSLLNTTQIIPIFLETQPPSPGIIQYAQYGQFLVFQNFSDLVGISTYYVGIGTKPRGNDLLNWTLTANGDVFTGPFLYGLCNGPGCAVSPLPTQLLSVATPVWFSIRAENRAGFWSEPVSAAFPIVLLGSDAAILTGSLTQNSTWGFEDSSAVATISGRLPTNATNTVALIAVGAYQYSTSRSTGITLVRPKALLVLRAGSAYATYASVHLHLLSILYDASFSKAMPAPSVNASIAVQTFGTNGPPVLYYQGQMNSSSFTPLPWVAQPTTSDAVSKTITWNPKAPGIYALYYNETFPSFTDVNGDSLADILYVIHPTVPDWTDYGWGILGSSIPAPSSKRQYVVSLSPSYKTVTNFAVMFLRNEVIVAVGDFDADGSVDYVLSTAGYPIYSPWGGVYYTIVFNQSSTPTMTIAPPKTGIYPYYYDQHILMGFSDLDGDTFLDSVWYSTGWFSIHYSPGITICSGKGGNYAAGCASPWYISFEHYAVLGMGSWSPGTTGIMTFQRIDNTVSFSITNLLPATSSTGAVTSISRLPLINISMSLQAQPWQVWLARISGDLNGDGTSDLVLQCTSYIGFCGPSGSLYSYTIVWYLNSVGKVISTGVLTTPSGSRLALGTLIYR